MLAPLLRRSHASDNLGLKLLIVLNVDAKRDVAPRGRRSRNRNRGVVSKRSDETRRPQRSAGFRAGKRGIMNAESAQELSCHDADCPALPADLERTRAERMRFAWQQSILVAR